MMRNKKTIAFCIVVTILLIIVTGCTSESPAQTYSEFSAEFWDENFRQRIYMIDDLLDRYEIVGMSEYDIINLLGERNMSTDTPNMIRYIISPGTISSIVFNIFLDENGVAYQYEIMAR